VLGRLQQVYYKQGASMESKTNGHVIKTVPSANTASLGDTQTTSPHLQKYFLLD